MRHIDFVRCCPCWVCGKVSSDRQPTHADHRPTRGSGQSRDDHTWPLCADHHIGPQGIHSLGEDTFQERYGVGYVTAIYYLISVYQVAWVSEVKDRDKAREIGYRAVSLVRESAWREAA